MLFQNARRHFISCLMLLLLVFSAATPLWAHAVLMASTPAINSTVNGPDIAISLRFNVRIDEGRSRVRLIAGDGSTTTLPLTHAESPDHLETRASGLKPGTYKL